jgi:signal peptidase I
MLEFINKFRVWLKRPNKSKIAQYIESFLIIVPIAFFIRTYFYGLYQVPTGSMETTMLVGERFFADKFSYLFRPIKYGDIITFNDPNFNYSHNYFTEVFQRYVWGPSNWTKRVIGLPGDHIKGVIEDGKPVIYRNGEKLDEPYLNKYPLIAVYNNKCLLHSSYDENYSFHDQPFYRMDEYDVELGKRWSKTYDQDWLRLPQTPSFDQYGRNVDIFDITLDSNQYWAMGDNRLGSYDSRFWGPLDGKLIHGKIIVRLWSIDSHESWWIVDLIRHPIDFWQRVRWSRFFQWVY